MVFAPLNFRVLTRLILPKASLKSYIAVEVTLSSEFLAPDSFWPEFSSTALIRDAFGCRAFAEVFTPVG